MARYSCFWFSFCATYTRMKISIAIVEDNYSDAEVLRKYIEQFCNEHNVSCNIDSFQSSTDFLNRFDNQYDVLFLDVELQDGESDGMEAAHIIRKNDPSVTIVFVTNLSKYAVEGYQVNASDFIVKPINYASFCFRFQNVLEKLIHQDQRAILIKTKGNYCKVLIKDIYYICIINHLCYFYGTFRPEEKEGELTCYESWMQLNAVQKEIDSERFVKCSPSYLINVDHISKLTKDSVVLGDTVLPLSRNKKKGVIEAYLASFGKR